MTGPLALDGIRVLDLTRLVPGPYATMLLCDLGADVIKVEEPGTGDYLRHVQPRYESLNTSFCVLNRGKKSLTLNLKHSEGRRILLDLARTSDVVIESFRPGVADRLGIGHSAVRAVNGRIVYCSLTGYGQEGSLRDAPGHDVNYLGYAGILDGWTDLPPVQIADIGGGGLMAVMAILAALFARERGKGGQYIDVSMLGGVLSWLLMPAAYHFAGQRASLTQLPLSGGLAGYGIYATQDGRWITLAAIEPKFWKAFCDRAGFSDVPTNQSDLRAKLEALFRTRTQSDWLRLVEGTDIPVGPVLTIEEALRDRLIWIDDPKEGRIAQLPFPVKLSGTPARPPSSPPRLGQHTDEILTGIGRSPAEVAALRDAGVV